jgi:hypothetical protein
VGLSPNMAGVMPGLIGLTHWLPMPAITLYLVGAMMVAKWP